MNTVLLGDIVDISSSKRIFYSEYVDKGVPFYRSKEIIEKAAGNSVSTPLNISEERFKEVSERFGAPESGDILLTSVGTLGIPYLVQDGERFYFKDGNLTWFRKYSNDLLPKYLYYWLSSPMGKVELEIHTIGSTQRALTIQGLKKVKLPLLPIGEQQRIVKILDSINEKVELNRRMNETLEKIGQALFKHYFIDNPKAKTWPKGKLVDVLDKINESLKSGREIADRIYLPIDRLKMHSLATLEPLPYTEAKSSLVGFAKDDILLGAMRVYFHRVNIAPSKGVTRTTTFVLRPKETYFKAFAVLLMNLDSTIDYANTHSKGTTMPYAVWENGLANMSVNMPPDKILEDFQGKAWPILETIRDSQNNKGSLSELRDSLLPRLISGKIKV